VRQEAVTRIAGQSAILSVWDVPTVACDLGTRWCEVFGTMWKRMGP
jgi:hypothetical protein